MEEPLQLLLQQELEYSPLRLKEDPVEELPAHQPQAMVVPPSHPVPFLVSAGSGGSPRLKLTAQEFSGNEKRHGLMCQQRWMWAFRIPAESSTVIC